MGFTSQLFQEPTNISATRAETENVCQTRNPLSERMKLDISVTFLMISKSQMII